MRPDRISYHCKTEHAPDHHKVHHRLEGAARTLCQQFPDAVTETTEAADEVTCRRCQRAMAPRCDEPRVPAEQKRAKAPAMTADEARTLDATSAQNAVSVQEQLVSDDRCLSLTCEPYVSIFTYKRWQAQGFQVRKGSKAAKAVTWVTRTEDGEEIRRPRTYSVFCRCQVDPIAVAV